VSFSGRGTGLEHVRRRVRGQLRWRVQRILATRRPTVATHVGAVASLASSRSSQEVRHDDGQSGPGHEQPPAKPQPIGECKHERSRAQAGGKWWCDFILFYMILFICFTIFHTTPLRCSVASAHPNAHFYRARQCRVVMTTRGFGYALLLCGGFGG